MTKFKDQSHQEIQRALSQLIQLKSDTVKFESLNQNIMKENCYQKIKHKEKYSDLKDKLEKAEEKIQVGKNNEEDLTLKMQKMQKEDQQLRLQLQCIMVKFDKLLQVMDTL